MRRGVRTLLLLLRELPNHVIPGRRVGDAQVAALAPHAVHLGERSAALLLVAEAHKPKTARGARDGVREHTHGLDALEVFLEERQQVRLGGRGRQVAHKQRELWRGRDGALQSGSGRPIETEVAQPGRVRELARGRAGHVGQRGRVERERPLRVRQAFELHEAVPSVVQLRGARVDERDAIDVDLGARRGGRGPRTAARSC